MNWPIFKIEWDHFTFRLLYKHFETFANRKYDEQSPPKKNPKVCDPILVPPLKMRAHKSVQS